MKFLSTVLFHLLLLFIFTSCGNAPSSGQDQEPTPNPGPTTSPFTENFAIHPDSVLFDFVYVGCNRVTHHDRHNSKTDASTANLAQLKKIYKEVSQLANPPEYFFFLGDMVLGESDTTALRRELKQWVVDFHDQSSGGINEYWNNKIKMIAIPGNHEMLTEDANYTEFPLKGATEIWLEEMKNFIPGAVNRDPSPAEQATYTFRHQNTFFVVMNTDTYNPNRQTGQIPVGWITKEMTKARKDASIKHILLLGHKPAYGYSTAGQFTSDTSGLATIHDSYVGSIWPAMRTLEAAAMLSAHKHEYDRFQPGGQGPFQVIAGNGGSLNGENGNRHGKFHCAHSPDFFGYSHIFVMKSGALIHKTRGWQIDPCNYLDPVPSSVQTCTYDSLNIAWGQQAADWSFGSGVNCH